MATHSSILAWKVPCREEPVRYTVHGAAESDTAERLTLSASPLDLLLPTGAPGTAIRERGAGSLTATPSLQPAPRY